MFDVSFRLSEAERNLKKCIYLKRTVEMEFLLWKEEWVGFSDSMSSHLVLNIAYTHMYTHIVKYKKVWNNVKNPIHKVIYRERKNVSLSSEHTG